MKRLALFLVFLSVVVSAGCALHIPGPVFDDEYGLYPIYVRLNIDPDDAEVYLDGRLIGEAYEFSAFSSSIRLSSHNHRLVFRRDGYFETVVDLDNYRGRRIILDQRLRPFSSEGTPAAQASEPARTENPAAGGDDGSAVAEGATTRYALILTIEPAEATIYVNGRFWGIVPSSGRIGRVAFAEKEIDLDVMKPGFKPWHQKIVLTEEGEELNVKLEEADQ